MNNPTGIITILVFFLLLSCTNNKNINEITSGRIDYKITYLNHNLDDKTREILPKHMKMVFDQKEAINYIEGFMGFFKMEALSNFHSRKCSTLLKVFDKHYLFTGKRDEKMCCFDSMDEMEVRETGETKKIAGFTCKKAVIYLPSTQTSFDIYYTGEIDLRHPNATNPYYKINGVLMEFELTLQNLTMRFTAEKYQPLAEALDEKIPPHTREVNRDEMAEILHKLLE